MEKLWPIHSDGAMESFTEAWNKLKELHEKEVIGLQTKLAELTMEKCRDAQRIEELFSKNHILREQQKALNENVKVLENRLRAGLCDRCTVTQEMAKKKQQEFESTHFQSLQHISSLTNEINGLKEDNKTLLDELNVLKNPQERIKAQSGPTQENRSNPNSPLPLASPVSRTTSLDRMPSREYEGREEASYSQLAEEKSGPRSSPRSRMSPVTDGRLYEMNPQRISNQLHGTIAVMRPGSRSCQQEKGSDGQTEAPSKVLTPTYLSDGNMTSNCHNNANATPNYHNDADIEAAEAASYHEALQHGSRREHLYRLGQQITQHRTGLRSHAISMDSMGRYTCHVPKARAAELGRKQSKDDWDERMPLVGRVVYLTEKDLRGRLSVLEQQERLQYFRVRKQQQPQWTRGELKNNQFLAGVYRDIQDGQPEQGERVHNKSLAETYHEKLARQVKQSEREQFIEHKKDALSSSDTLDLKERGLSFQNSKNPEPTDNEWPQQSFPPDKPLDLSDYGRGRDSSGSLEDICNTLGQPVLNHQTTESKTGHSPSNILHSKDNNQCSRSSSPVAAGNQMQRDNDSDHRNDNDGDNDGSSLDWKSSPQGHDVGDSALCAREETSGIRLRLSVRRPNPDLETQPDDDDGESIKRESDEVESTDSETTVRYDTAGSMKDKIQGSMKKRKRGHDPWTKAHRRFSKGRKKGKALQTPPEAEAMEKNTSSSSDVFGDT